MPVVVDPDFARLPSGLAALFGDAAERSYFSHPVWYETFARHVGEPGSQVRIYVDDERAPCVGLVTRRLASGRTRLLASLANYYSCEHEMLRRPGLTDFGERLAAVIAEVAAASPRPDALRLIALDRANGDFAALAAALRGARMVVSAGLDFGTWYEETGSLDFQGYLARRPSILLNTWRRKVKKARTQARFAFFEDPAEIEPGIAGYETIYRASWKEAEPFGGFIPALMRASAGLGALRLGICYLDDQPAAAQMWIVWRGRAVIYKLAHDAQFDAVSPGTLLTMKMLERVLERDRPTEINFGRGDDPYKKLWLPQRRECWRLDAANPRTLNGTYLAMRGGAAALYHRARAIAAPRRSA